MQMNNIDKDYAIASLESWFHINRQNFQKCGASIKFNDSTRGFAEIQIETNKYLISISAWDHGACLEIQILEIESEDSIFPTVGGCKTRNIFENHRDSFLIWFNNEHKCN